MIKELEYIGEIEGKVCAICKLTFRANDTILACPQCESLFHKEHLIEWLSIDNECPVCERDFTIEIEKYLLREKRTKSGITLARKRFTLNNPDLKASFTASKVLIIIFGLIVALLPTVAIALTVPLPAVFAAMIGSLIFYSGGIAIVNLAITQYRFYWTDIAFSKKGITIDANKESQKDISRDEINEIKLRISEFTTDNSKKTTYHLALEFDTERGYIDFGKIVSSGNYEIVHQFRNKLERQTKKLLNIDPVLTNFSASEYLRKSRRMILISGLIFIILNAILIPIGHFLI